MRDDKGYALLIVLCLAAAFFVLSFADAIDRGMDCSAPKSKREVRL